MDGETLRPDIDGLRDSIVAIRAMLSVSLILTIALAAGVLGNKTLAEWIYAILALVLTVMYTYSADRRVDNICGKINLRY